MRRRSLNGVGTVVVRLILTCPEAAKRLRWVQNTVLSRSTVMRRFILPLAALLALVVGTSTAKAQLIVASPYSGYYSAGYLAQSTVYVAPSVGYYSSSYPSYTYYDTPYYYGSYS